MADSSSRRRSPESSRRRRRERRAASRERTNATTAAFTPAAAPTNYYDASTPGPTMQDRSAPIDMNRHHQDSYRGRPGSSSSGSSSTSSSLLDISRRYSGEQKNGGVFQSFFRAPSERRRLRRRRSGKKKKRVLYFGNSSSSSLNSDLAYGTGYIPRRKSSRDFSQRHHHQNSAPVAATAAAAAAGATYATQNQSPMFPQGPSQYAPSHGHSQSYSHPPPQNTTENSSSWGPGATATAAVAGATAAGLAAEYYNADREMMPSKPTAPRRRKTDDEIMAIGRQLSDLAKAKNEGDLRAAGISKPSGLVSAATKLNDYRDSRYGTSRGIGGSRIRVDSSADDSDWESASDDDSEDSADSNLAFGTVVSSAIRPTAAAAAGAAAGAAMASGSRNRDGRSAVDPRLFGPVNSLHGMVTPRPFDDDGKPINREPRPLTRSATEPMGPMRNVYPMATSDPNRFDVSSKDLPHRARPGPVPLQQPTPRHTVSPKVYDAEKLEDATRRVDKPSRKSEDSGWGGVAAAGVAAGLAGAALTKDRKESRDYRDDEKRDREKRSERSDKRDKEREKDRDKEKDKRRDKDRDKDREREKEEKRKSKRDSYSSKYPDDKDRDKDRKRSSRYDDREEKESKKSRDAPQESTRESYKRRDKDEPDDGRSELSRLSKRDSAMYNLPAKYDKPQETRQLSGPEKAGSHQATIPDQPLQSSAVDPFQYQVEDFATAPTEPPRPLTPNVFTVDREPVWDSTDDELPQGRLSRKDSFEIEQMVEENRKRRSPEQERRSVSDYVTSKAEHAVAPVGVAAMAGAIVAESARSKDRKRDAYSDNGSEVRTSPRDAVQEEADRYYREAEMARKIASDKVRSRDHTPDHSLVDKYDQDDNVHDVPTIVTPPEYKKHEHTIEEHHADFKLDNRWTPSEAARYTRGLNEPVRDAERERPYLNLIYPTPASSRKPTPAIEQQEEKSRSADRDFKDDSEKDRRSKDRSSKSRDKDRDETSRSEVGTSKRRTKDRDERSSKSEVGASSSHRRRTKDFEDETSKSDAGAVVVVGPDGDIQTPKSVSWGENRTNTFEVVTPEPREDRELGGSKTRPQLDKSSQWGAIATAISANGREPRNEPDIMVTESPKEMEADSRSRDMPVYHVEDAPPVPGPKPASPGPQQMPGGFADDIEFAATLAAGLEKTGFDANMVIDDPTYRRRDSPPGSNELNGNGTYQKPLSETVSDLHSREPQPGPSEPGYILGEVETPGDSSRAVEPTDELAEAPTKLSKKERKKQEKLKKQQEAEAAFDPPVEAPEPPPAVEEPPIKLSKKEQRKRDKEARARALASQDDEMYAEPEQIKEPETFEDAWEEPSDKKKSRKSRDFDDGATSVSVPVDAFADLVSSRDAPEGEWDDDKKSKKKSKRDSKSYDSMSKSVDNLPLSRDIQPDDDWEESKQSKKKSKRDSLIYDSPSRSVNDLSKIGIPDEDEDDKKSRRRSKRDSGAYDSPTRSAAPSEAGSEVSRKSSKKSKRRSGIEDDFNEYGDHPPDRGRDPFEDRDVSSVVSEPRDDKRSSRRSYRYDDDDDAKSVASAPGGGRKKVSEKRSSGGLFSSIFKKDDDKKNKESFLDNAGTLGAGVGLAGLGIAAADSLSRHNATEPLSEKKDPSEEIADWSRDVHDDYDPGIFARAIKPAIDPQYGDLLPLPPSEPGSPVKSPEEELPSLPESRPDTPPEEQSFRHAHTRRKSAHETPAKSPSNTAIPFQLRLGNRSGPSSPALYKSSPVASPVAGMPDSPGSARKARPTSWDDSREYKPLYLLEHNRQGPKEDPIDQADLPALPPSEASSRSSPGPGSEAWESADEYAQGGYDDASYEEPTLRLDTSLPAFTPGHERAGSNDTTPKAEIKPEFPDISGMDNQEREPDPVEPMSKDRSSYLLQSAPSSTKSNKTVDNDTVAQNLREIAETPSKPGNKNSLGDLDENLTSADEHFSDAREDKNDRSPSRSRDLSVDTPLEAVTAPETPAERSSADATPPSEEPAEDFGNLTGKAKKKAKKAAKKKQALSLDVSAPSEEPSMEAPDTAKETPAQQAAETEVENIVASAAEPSPDQLADQPAAEEPPVDTQDTFETPKKGKKGKKNKKKASSWEDELPAAAGAAAIAGAAAAAIATADDDNKDTDVKALDDTRTSAPEAAEGAEQATRAIEEPVDKSAQPAEDVEAPVDTPPSEPTAQAEASAEPEPELDAWESTGKKSKKKKKKGKAPLPLDEEPTVTESSALEPAPADEVTIESKSLPVEEPTEPEAVAAEDVSKEPEHVDVDEAATAEASVEPSADETWSAPPLSKKEKKKQKKKALQTDSSWIKETEEDVPESSVEPSAAEEEVAKPSTQEADFEAKPADLETPLQAEPSTSADTPVQAEEEFAPVSKKKKKKDKKKALQLQLDASEEPKPSDDKDLGTVEEPLTAIAATGDDASAWDQTLEDKQQTPQAEEIASKDADEPGLHSEVSEPLFSQDGPSATTTQDPTTQASDVFSPEKDTSEPAEASWEAPPSKKKGKKNKKKQQQAMSLDEPEEPKIETAPETEAEPTPDDWSRETEPSHEPAEVSYLEPIAEDEEVPAGHAWERYGQQYPQESDDWDQYDQEGETPRPADDGWDMDDDFFSKPTPREEVADDLGWDKPQAAATEKDEPSEDEWSTLVTGKKAKKNKKKQEKLSMEKALDLVQDPSPEAGTAASSSRDAPPESLKEEKEQLAEDEWATPSKKSKKNKKKKAASLWDEEPGADDKPPTSDEPTYQATQDEEMQEGASTPRPPSSGTDATEIWQEAESEMPEESKTEEQPAAADDNDFLIPAKLSKKDKKKKKKQAALEATSTEDDKSAEPETKEETMDAESVAGTTDDSPDNTSGFVTPAESVSGEANPDDEWGGFSSKKSKKEKKKKKAKDLESEQAQEPTTAEAPTEISPESEPQVTRALDEPGPTDDVVGSGYDESTTTGDGMGETQGSEQEQEFGLSKKEKKKKKKAKALAFDEPEETATQELEPTDKTQFEDQTFPQEESVADDDWTSGLSKKDKKKKRKSVTFDLGDTPAPGDEKAQDPVDTDIPSPEQIEAEPSSSAEPPKEGQIEPETQGEQDAEDASKQSDMPMDSSEEQAKSAPEDDAADAWAAPLSKKDKKKKKKAQQAAAALALDDPEFTAETTADQAPEPEFETDRLTAEDVPPKPEEALAQAGPSSEPETPSQDASKEEADSTPVPEVEDDESWAAGLSKSQKKKRKKAMAAAAVAYVAAVADAVETPDDSSKVSEEPAEAERTLPSEDLPARQESEVTPTEDVSEMVDFAVSTEAVEPPNLPTEDVDDWSAGLSKKDKKAKKKAAKAQAFDDWESAAEPAIPVEEPFVQPEAESQAEADVTQPSDELPSVAQPSPETQDVNENSRTEESLAEATSSGAPAESVEDDESWAVGLTKSQKKKRKKQMEKEKAEKMERETTAEADSQPTPEAPVMEETPSPTAPAADASESAAEVAEGVSPPTDESAPHESRDEPALPIESEQIQEVEAEPAEGQEAEAAQPDIPKGISALPDEDDESWAIGLSAKEKKKRKKQMKKEREEAAAMEWESPVPPLEETKPEAVEGSQDSTAADKSIAQPELGSEAAGGDTAMTEDTSAVQTEEPTASAPADDDWSAGLSKKDKKKKKKAKALSMEWDAPTEASDPTEAAAPTSTAFEEPTQLEETTQLEESNQEPEDLTQPMEFESTAQAQALESAAEVTESSTPVIDDNEDWSAGLSKKDKKKKKKAKALAMDWDEPAQPEPSEPPQNTDEPSVAQTDPDTAAPEEAPESEAAQEAEMGEVAADTAPESPAPVADEEDEFAGLSSKEKKKRKKAKAKAQAMAWDEPTESRPSESPQTWDESSASPAEPEAPQPSEAAEAATETQEPEILQEPQVVDSATETTKEVSDPTPELADEFAGLSKKEKKKRMKAKAQAAEWDALAEPAQPEVSETTAAVEETAATEPETKPDVLQEAEATDSISMPSETIEKSFAEEEDEYAGLSNKEKKKRKKAKEKALAMAWEQPEETLGESQEPVLAEPKAAEDKTDEATPTPPENTLKPEPEDEDEYAGLTKSQKKKRKKEKERALAMAWEQPEEPPAESQQDEEASAEHASPSNPAIEAGHAAEYTAAETQATSAPETAPENVDEPGSTTAVEPIAEDTTPPEDEWGFGLSKKDKKKKKKDMAKLTAMDWEPTPEPVQETQAPEESQSLDQPDVSPQTDETRALTDPEVSVEPPVEASQGAPGDGSNEPVQEAVTGVTPESTAETPVEPTVEDEWGLGLSKKDKKKKKKQQKAQALGLDWDTPAEPVKDAASDQPELVEASTEPKSEELAPEDNPEQAEAGAEEASFDIPTEDPTDAAANISAEPSADTTTEAPKEEDDWASGLSKKDKKKKKKEKARALDMDWEPAGETAPEPTPAEEPAESSSQQPEMTDEPREGLVVEPSPAVDESTPDAATVEPSVEASKEPVTEADDWGFGLSKKEKKKKKKAKATAMDWEAAAETAPDASKDASEQATPEEPVAVHEVQVDEPQVELDQVADEPTPESAPTEPAADNDGWGFDLSKKDKKKKKKAQALGMDWEPAPEDSSAATEPEIVAETDVPVTDKEPLVEEGQFETAQGQLTDEPTQPEDDPWSAPSSKKDKKKKKKGKAMDLSAWDEPESSKSESATPAEDATEPEKPQEVGAPEEPEFEPQPEPAPDNDDGFALAGLSKKDKKKLKKKALAQGLPDPFAEADPSEEVPSGEAGTLNEPEEVAKLSGLEIAVEESPAKQGEIETEPLDRSAPEPMQSEDTKQPEAAHQTEDTAEAFTETADAPDEVQEPEDWLPTKKTKKEKKKAQKAAALAAALVADNEPSADPSSASREAEQTEIGEAVPMTEEMTIDSTPPAGDEPSQPTESWPEASNDDPMHEPETGPADDSQPPGDDDFGFAVTTKKSKKDKKKKKQAALDLSAPGPETEESKEITETSTSASWADEGVAQPEPNTLEPQPAESMPADDNDEWAMPTKKSKKAKKLKASQLAMPDSQIEVGDSSSQAVVPEEALPADKFADETQQPDVVQDAQVDAPYAAGEDNKDSRPEETVAALVESDEQPPRETAPEVVEKAPPTVAEPEPQPEDAWAIPVTKKSKKDKKRKSQQGTPSEPSRAASPTRDAVAAPVDEETQPLEGQVPQEAAPDDWLEGFGTTKSKKKKKKAKALEEAALASTAAPVIDTEPTEAEPQSDRGLDMQKETATADPDVPMEDIQLDEQLSESKKASAKDLAEPRGLDLHQQTWEFPQQTKDTAMDHKSMATEESEAVARKSASDRKTESAGIGSAVAAGAAAAGAAAVVEKATPGKKGKKGKKNKKSIDKRQPQEDDIFDDPSLWENADKRNLQEDEDKADDGFWGEGEQTKGQLAVKENDDFWGGGEGEEEAEATKEVDDFWGGEGEEPVSTRSLGKEPTTPKPAETWAQPGDPALEASASLLTPTTHDIGTKDKARSGDKSKDPTITPQSESFSGSDEGWKETAQRGAPLDDYEDEDSPVLGRGEQPTSRSRPALLRRGSDLEEPVGGLLREDSQASALSGPLGSDFGGTRLSPARSLPGIQEVPEAEGEATTTTTRGLPQTPEMNRDSGYVESPRSSFRSRSRGHLFVDQPEEQRDSGYHADDWEGSPTQPTETPKSHKKLSRSSYGTPKLQEPAAPELTPEPEKKSSKSRQTASSDYYEQSPLRSSKSRDLRDAPSLKSSKSRTERDLQPSPSLRSMKSRDYGDLRSEADKKPSALPVAAAATSSQRSVSDNSHSAGSGQPRRLDSQPQLRRSLSNTSLARKHTPEPLKFRPESPGTHSQGAGIRSTPTPPLRRVDKRVSGDLRSLRQQPSHSALSSSSPGPTPDPAASSQSQSQSVPVANEGRVRSKDMADVYDGFGEGRMGSPRSPTRPHSMRRRQSMQVLELESRVDQLMAENRLLTEARSHAEQNLSQRATSVLSERDSEIEALKQSLQFLQNEVSRLTEVNDGLTSANAELAQKDNGRYADLEVRHADVARELDEARGSHNTFEQSLQDKDAEIADLRAQLEDAKEQVREMQRQILASKSGDADFLDVRDEDHFDNRCQQLCSHVQQWVLRFSKFSDMRACRLTSEINDEKTIDRLDNAVLDGSDVDRYLSDRVKRRDIFMSMTMNMIWEFVFTRYLFGMDREQRQKLKSLEKMLTEVGPPNAVRQWRAVTLTLLARRDNFRQQKDQDTEAVVQAIFQTLCKILPPPGNLENQIQSQLRRVLREAVDLSIEMRTQKAEYMMLPPLQPEYDSEGELAATVQFNSSMMNERSGKNASTNEDLEAEGAVVRVVLFPLVVKKGDDAGVGDEEIVVCPAQVIVAGDKGRRSFAPSSDAGGASLGGRSHISVVTEHMGG